MQSNKNQLEPKATGGGVLSWFAANHVAANLVMIFVIVWGLLSLAQTKIEFFPEVPINWVSVELPYPGASPEEVETGVTVPVEEAVREVDNVKEVTSVAQENMALVLVELETYADRQKAKDDIENAIDRITTFPEEAEEPVISLAEFKQEVLRIAVYGEVSDATLKELGEEIRDDLTTGRAAQMIEDQKSAWSKLVETFRPRKGITTVSLDGLPPYEISIDIREEDLRKHNLRFEDVAMAVRRASLDLSAGAVKTEDGEILIRTTGQMYRGPEFEDVVVISNPDGTVVRVRDVADVHDTFAETDRAMRFNGKPAVAVSVSRIGQQDALEVANTVKAYVKVKAKSLPEGVSLDTYFDQSILLTGRINLLLRNAAIGLALVFICLALFLDLRLAFWTTLGIPMSFLGAFILLPVVGVSINMISLFAFIVVLGIVVDDAIVVGENIFAYRQRNNVSALRASIMGVKEMAAPVTMAIITTIAAFAPLVVGEGTWGEILRVIPLVVISVLLLSLVEAFLVLPAHLQGGRVGGRGGPISVVQKKLREVLDWVISGPYTRILRAAMKWRYATLAVAIAMLMFIGGLVGGGHVGDTFFPTVEADQMIGALSMPPGTPPEKTIELAREMEAAANRVAESFRDERPPDAPDLYQRMVTNIGAHPAMGEMQGRGGGMPEVRSGGHLAEVVVELLDGSHRDLAATTIVNRWRDEVGEIPGAVSLDFSAEFMSADAISVELSHREFDLLVRAAEDLKQLIGQYKGVTDLTDTFVEGKPQIEVVGLKPRGEVLGVNKDDIARQLRAAFYGEEIERVQRGRDEVKVMVRYPREERASVADLENLRIRLADGTEIPVMDVADVRWGRGYASINRANSARTVSVIADIDTAVTSSKEINANLREKVLPALMAEYPGLSFDLEGEQKERNESMASLKRNFFIALLAIYALLAVQFRSYVQPIIVMVAIPFGIVGAVLGHVMMGLPLSFMSFFGIVALTGVVVNDSLIMIDLINRERVERQDESIDDVVEHSGTRRFRPIILTTFTTFFGLMPMILETSVQAKFLIPMAVSLGFGVLFATTITLLLVPALYLILGDVRQLFLGRERAEKMFHEAQLTG
jgi:multidrug efflux pump subunit AcrB